jgi:tyrosyl-tRNA synthetase
LASDVFNLLESRGYIYQCTHPEEVKRLLESDEKITFYLGIDPTADSLHIGHFFALMMFRYLQDAGHRGILLVGGATALVGDPSGKSDMRKMLTKEQVEHNLREVTTLAKRFIKTDGDNPAIFRNNAEWMNGFAYVDFMRRVGVHFNINVMLSADAYSNRLKQGGLTFLEMGYMLMQAYDFVQLNRDHGCRMQIGGSDQWGNIVAGTALNRKLRFAERSSDSEPGPEEEALSEDLSTEIFGLTCPLLLTKDGKKMGKTEHGAMWVAREKTTAYDFYQYFYNVDDEDVNKLLKLFTYVPLPEIERLCSEDIIQAKKTMALEITKLVHGEEEAERVLNTVNSLFGKEVSGETAPESDFMVQGDEINVIDLFFKSGFASSNGEVRRLIRQNGASVDGQRILSETDTVKRPADRDYVLLRKGKKSYLKVRFAK